MKEKINKTIYILKEALSRFKNPAVMWSTGKDSTVMLDLLKQAYPDEKIRIPVVHIDTGKLAPEIYKYRKMLSKKWSLPLTVLRNPKYKEYSPDKQGHFNCCMELKTNALKNGILKNKWDALIMSIRRDEHHMRMIERYFSPRDKEFKWNFVERKKEGDTSGDSDINMLQETEFDGWNLFQTDFGDKCSHVRVHPILHWDEIDIWKYIKEKGIPVNPLYFAENGKRYRSLGCMPCTKPFKSNVKNVDDMIEELKKTEESERMGRHTEKEQILRRLRALGYM